MVIYIEGILAINSLIHYNFSIFTGRVIHEKISKKRLMIGVLIINLYLLLYMFLDIFDNYKYLIGLILLLITFRKNIQAYIIYFGLNVILGGLINLLNYNLLVNQILIIFFSFFLIILLEILIPKIKIKNINDFLSYDCRINNCNYKAFLDTGNKLMVDGLPVIFLKKIIKAKYIKSIRLSTVSGSSIIGIYKADVYINNSYIDCYIAFGKQEYDCLLNINMINRLEGIKNV